MTKKNETQKLPAFIIAAANSGSGKTTLALGIMEAFRRMGLSVQAFKAGPDYIDPGLHKSLLGKPSYNLDTWMMGVRGVRRTFASKAAGADAAVIEGVMGLYDGRDGRSEAGSTAHLSKVLGVPVLLVVNAEKAARSIGALVKGFEAYDPKVDIRWIVFNRVGSLRHFSILKDSVSAASRKKVIGCIPRDGRLVLPERHLGLTASKELKGGAWQAFIKASGDIAGSLDLKRLLRPSVLIKKTSEKKAKKPSARIAVAYDEAFSFYYEENLEILRDHGAELVFFSPMRDKGLPEGTSGIYIGGGYPELNAEALSANRSIRDAVKKAALCGAPVFAECGGLMYLGRTIETNGRRYAMAGVFPWGSRMLEKRKALGYREVDTLKACPFPVSGRLRGHEFHYSEIPGPPLGVKKTFRVLNGNKEKSQEGYSFKNTLASYVHLHFRSNPEFAARFVECALKNTKGKKDDADRGREKRVGNGRDAGGRKKRG